MMHIGGSSVRSLLNEQTTDFDLQPKLGVIAQLRATIHIRSYLFLTYQVYI